MTLGAGDASTDGVITADQITDTEEAKVEGRSLGQIAWARIRKDRIALISAVIIVLIIVVALLAPLIGHLRHLDPGVGYNTPTSKVLRDSDAMPIGGVLGSGTSAKHWFGVEPGSGRDVFIRLVYGTRISLLVALGGTIFAMILGTIIGMVAGYFRGWVDSLLGRIMDIMLSFPSLLFILAVTPVIVDRATHMGFGDNTALRMGILIFVLGFFGWAYLARIVRGQTLSIREREFVEAARAMGAGSPYVIFKQILPNLLPTLLVFATLTLPTNITAEASLSFLGAGVKPPTSSWGVMIDDAQNSFQADPLFLFFPGVALLITVLAFNLLGDSVRDALDPRAGRH